LRVTLIILVY